MSNTNQQEADLALVNSALQKLGEHFDSVQIFVTRQESGELDGTVHISKGEGNWFTRYGHIQTWLEQEYEHIRIKARKDSQL